MHFLRGLNILSTLILLSTNIEIFATQSESKEPVEFDYNTLNVEESIDFYLAEIDLKSPLLQDARTANSGFEYFLIDVLPSVSYGSSIFTGTPNSTLSITWDTSKIINNFKNVRIDIEKSKNLKQELIAKIGKLHASLLFRKKRILLRKELLELLNQKMLSVSKVAQEGFASDRDLFQTKAEILGKKFELYDDFNAFFADLIELKFISGKDLTSAVK